MSLTIEHPSTARTAPRFASRPPTIADLAEAFFANEKASRVAFDAVTVASDKYMATRPPIPNELVHGIAAEADGIVEYAPSPDFPRAIRAYEIQRAISCLERNTHRHEYDSDGRLAKIEINDDGFPLTDEQKERLARLKTRLPIAIAYEAAIEAHKDAEYDALQRKADDVCDEGCAIVRKITRAKAKTGADLLLKISVWKKDREAPGLADSIIADTARILGS